MKKIPNLFVIFCGLLISGSLFAAPLSVDITGAGISKTTVAVEVADPVFAKCLRRNLEISGLFDVRAGNASIRVTGQVGAGIRAAGAGKAVSLAVNAGDERAVRMAARNFANAMVKAYGGANGFACDRITFVNRAGSNRAEICACYPDGWDISRLMADNCAAVGPRWKDTGTILYTDLRNGPQVWELDAATGRHRPRWAFKGLTTGAAVSPDGTQVALIMSFQGNPELYVIDLTSGNWRRLTKTVNASEGQPSWSPDGKSIVYVSDETRHPQLHVIDLASGKQRRLTSRGSQNVDPDWGRDGRITYITKRQGASYVAVLEPSEGDASARIVSEAGNWEHPSWSRNMRHLVASNERELFLLDTIEGGDKPRRVFNANGNWITPSWSR